MHGNTRPHGDGQGTAQAPPPGRLCVPLKAYAVSEMWPSYSWTDVSTMQVHKMPKAIPRYARGVTVEVVQAEGSSAVQPGPWGCLESSR